MEIFDYRKIDKEKYSQNKPFPHIVLNDGWNKQLLDQCNKDIYKITEWDSEKEFYGATKKEFWRTMIVFQNLLKKLSLNLKV